MNIRQLHIQNFRNYKERMLVFNGGVNLFVGMNAQGKTNLIEAMYMLSAGKSHRATKDSELVIWGEQSFRLNAKINRIPREVDIEISYSLTDGKTVKVNGGEPIKPSKLTSFLNVVMFTPDDLDLLKGSPAQRRRFLDLEISQANPVYRSTLLAYNKVLNQRNSLIKNVGFFEYSEEVMAAFTDQLVELGAKIMAKRAEFVRAIGVAARMSHRKISGSKENLTLKYVPSFISESLADQESIKEAFNRKLKASKSIELSRRVTMYGPHRDDVHFDVDSVDMHTYGSQGQQRSCVLSLKIAEVEYLRSVVGDSPVLLLDDVLSELDEIRRECLIKEAVEKHQTMITSADPDCLRFLPTGASVFEIKDGEVGEPS